MLYSKSHQFHYLCFINKKLLLVSNMNVIIIGSGGRECTLAWKIAQSSRLNQLYIAPGNAGTHAYGENVVLDIFDFEAVGKFCLDHAIDFIIVGPEAPLVAGIYDHFQEEKYQGITVIGPSQEGAKLEGSKAYAKKFMQTFQIPTAGYGEYTMDTLAAGLKHIENHNGPFVLKADGLAAGKGVLIIHDKDEAKAELKAMLQGKFGNASHTVIIEDFLDGIEFSVFVITDGKDYFLLPEAKDYKRIGEGDTGLNTGGMGAISPVPFCDNVLMQKVKTRIIEPTIRGIYEKNIPYQGFIFFGLINIGGDPYVIEYNCRMGDPETEVVIPRLKNDFLELMEAVKNNNLDQIRAELDPRTAATVMLVSGGYPEAYEKGKIMTGMNDVTDSFLFHAGTKNNGADIVTNGGRVIAITSFGQNIEEAVGQSKENAIKISFDGKYYRQDIGFDLV